MTRSFDGRFSVDYNKTTLYVCNVDENSAVNGKYVDQVREW
jgi:ribosome-binding ATPase YchF (GTP1/OBG family)